MRKILTLCIIQKDDEILLGMKKRGFGMGKWNGFGGKVEKGETLDEAMQREVFKETGLTVEESKLVGVLECLWVDAPRDVHEIHIFAARHFTGTITETEEMRPKWFQKTALPYTKMWQGDVLWLPLLLKDTSFTGKVVFDAKNTVVEYEIIPTSIHE